MTRRAGEGSIRERRTGLWEARVRGDDGRQHSLYGKTYDDVADKLLTARSAQRDGTLVTSGRFPFSGWLDQWLSDHVKPDVAQTTYERYRGIVNRYVVPELGRVSLNQLTTAHVRRLYARLRERGLAIATVSLIHSVIHRALRDARRDGLVGKNVAEDAAPASPRRDASGRALTVAQLQVFDHAIRGHPHEPLWRILLLTGLRIGEAAALRWCDVDLEQGRLDVHRSYRRTLAGPVISAPKTARGRRTIPLGKAGIRALKAQKLLAPAWSTDTLVFPNRLGGPFRADKVLAEFKRVLADAGLPERRLHDLRHTFATGLFARGVSHRAAQELLGHARLEMTMDLYTGSVPEVLDDAIARMDDLFGGAASLG